MALETSLTVIAVCMIVLVAALLMVAVAALILVAKLIRVIGKAGKTVQEVRQQIMPLISQFQSTGREISETVLSVTGRISETVNSIIRMVEYFTSNPFKTIAQIVARFRRQHTSNGLSVATVSALQLTRIDDPIYKMILERRFRGQIVILHSIYADLLDAFARMVSNYAVQLMLQSDDLQG